jgi:hypothetical protein
MKTILLLMTFLILLLPGCRIDDSDPVMTVYGSGDPAVFTKPEEGVVIDKGSVLQMNWTGFNVKYIRLELLKKKLYEKQIIIDSYENRGSYNWNVPVETTSSVSYQVKLINANDENDYIYSPVFEIR